MCGDPPDLNAIAFCQDLWEDADDLTDDILAVLVAWPVGGLDGCVVIGEDDDFLTGRKLF